jgi:hypothetical protein
MKKFTFILLLITSLWAALPFFGRNYIPTHDGEYHIIRIVEFARMLGAGYIVPRWAPDLNSGYGIPIFNYHYPLTNYIGSFVRLFTQDAVYAFQISMGLGYVTIAVTAYCWFFVLFGAIPAFVGAAVAAFVPYLFVDMYVRGSIGEVWATALLFISLYLLEKKKYVLFAFSYGLLILSHNIMAMLFTPFIIGYILLRQKRAIIWMAGGIGLSAFFWLPALLESKYVVGLNTVNFREHFVDWYNLIIPSWGSGFSGSASPMSTQIGIAPMIAILLVLFSKRTKLLNYFISVLLVSIVLMLPISKPLWEFAKPLRLIQYPWRFLSFVIPVAGFCAAFWVYVTKKPWMGVVLVILAVVFAASYARPVLYAPRNESYYLTRQNFMSGTSSMGNSFSTIWTGWKDTPATGGATLYFPGWKAFEGGREVPIVNEDGVIRVPSNVTLRLTETPVRLIADIISVGSVLFLILYAYCHRHYSA